MSRSAASAAEWIHSINRAKALGHIEQELTSLPLIKDVGSVLDHQWGTVHGIITAYRNIELITHAEAREFVRRLHGVVDKMHDEHYDRLEAMEGSS